MTSIIIPAHNEERVIGRLLDAILLDAAPEEFEVLVVCNGCTDHTAEIAQQYQDVRVLELAQGSKHLALLAGDQAATRFPRLYVDADVVLDTAGARALTQALHEPGIHAVAPSRDLRLPGSSWPVRAYHRVWSELPVVQQGLFGRGALGVDELGYRRIADRPQVMGDDLYVHSQFSGSERRIVAGATSVVYGPRTVGDLLNRRTRAAHGNTELAHRPDGHGSTSVASGRDLLRMASRKPALWPSIPAFIGITLLARRRARTLANTGRPAQWLRDESSRG